MGPRSVMWWTKWHRDGFFAEYFGFPLSASFHLCSIIVFIYVLLLPDVQTAKSGNLLKKQRCSKIGELQIESNFTSSFTKDLGMVEEEYYSYCCLCILIVVYVFLLFVHVFLTLSVYSYCCLCILIIRPCILIVVYVFLSKSMYSYCCLCILIVRPRILIAVYVFLLFSMYSYCSSMYS